MNGGFIPFKKTSAERLAVGDPRPSLEERYGTLGGYVCAVTRATRKEVGRRFLLDSDAAKLIAEAKTSNVLPVIPATEAAKTTAQSLCHGL